MTLQASDDPQRTQCNNRASTNRGGEFDAEFIHIEPIH